MRAKILKYVVCVAILVTTIVCCCNNIFTIYIIDGDSMNPTLKDGDIVLAINTQKVDDDDIVIVDATEIVGITGYNYIVKRYCEEKSSKGIYIIGDNKECSIDSDDFGEIPCYMLEGKVVAVFYR